MQIRYSNIGAEPITSTEVKAWLKVDYSDDDTIISALITQVREIAENVTGLALVSKTIEYFEDDEDILSDWIKLPYPEHDGITEVELDGVVITGYYVTGLSQKLIKVSGFTTTDSDSKGLKVTYTTSGDCPNGVKLAMLKYIAENYDKRHDTFDGSLTTGKDTFYNYLSQFKQL